MIKIIKQYKDDQGNPYTIEGTPQEIEEYEKSLEKKASAKTERRERERKLLKDEVRRCVEEEITKHRLVEEHHHHYYQNSPIQWIPSPYGLNPPNDRPWYWPTIICQNDDKLVVGGNSELDQRNGALSVYAQGIQTGHDKFVQSNMTIDVNNTKFLT